MLVQERAKRDSNNLGKADRNIVLILLGTLVPTVYTFEED